MVGCGGGGGGGGGSTNPVSYMCQKAESCGLIDSNEVSACVSTLASLEMLMADPERTVTCAKALTCEQMASESYVIDTCIAYDTSKFACQSSTVLQVCDIYSTCRDVDCSAACEKYYSASGSCGHDGSAGYDKCLCVL